jgi:hypothetical protein
MRTTGVHTTRPRPRSALIGSPGHDRMIFIRLRQCYLRRIRRDLRRAHAHLHCPQRALRARLPQRLDLQRRGPLGGDRSLWIPDCSLPGKLLRKGCQQQYTHKILLCRGGAGCHAHRHRQWHNRPGMAVGRPAGQHDDHGGWCYGCEAERAAQQGVGRGPLHLGDGPDQLPLHRAARRQLH